MTQSGGIVERFGEWLYWHGPSTETFTQFYVTVVATTIVILLVKMCEPYFRIWGREKERKLEKRLEENRDLQEKSKHLVWRPRTDQQRRDRDEVLEDIRKKIISFILIVGGVSILFLVMKEGLDRSYRDTEVGLRGAIGENIEIFDDVASTLWQKTTGSTRYEEKCYNSDGAALRSSESFCRERAGILASQGSHKEIVQAYRLCMVERGWMTEQCACHDQDDRCFTLRGGGDLKCSWSRWRAKDLYLGVECAGHLLGDVRKIHDQQICSQKATLFAEDRWYDGYTEFDRLTGTVMTYKVCTAEKGWQTEECPKNDRTYPTCVEMLFNESQCMRETRVWLAGNKERRPCLKASRWVNKSREESLGRQW